MLCYALTFTASHQFVYQTIIVEKLSVMPVHVVDNSRGFFNSACSPASNIGSFTREIRDGFVPVILSGMLELEAFRRQIKRKSGPPT